jgi:four helix bundle protein
MRSVHAVQHRRRQGATVDPIYTNHLWIAHGSGAELETQLELGARVKVVSEQEAAALISDTQEIGRMLMGLVASLERSVAGTR